MTDASTSTDDESRSPVVVSIASLLHRRPGVHATARMAGDIRLPNSWFASLNAHFKRRVREWFPTPAALKDPLANGSSDQTPWHIQPTSTETMAAPLSTRRQEQSSSRVENSVNLALTAMRKEFRTLPDREKQAQHIAFREELSELPTRRHFLERVRVAIDNHRTASRGIAVLYIDLDSFKAINDTYGHDAGDSLLKIVANRITHALRGEDLVSRLGGDEYACLVTGVESRIRLGEIALSLFDAISKPSKVGVSMLEVRPSIGIAMYPFDGTTMEALMRSADAAMYEAKRKQSGTAFTERAHVAPLCGAGEVALSQEHSIG